MTTSISKSLLVASITLLAAGCSSSNSLPTLNSIGSIGSNKVSETDRVFLMAIGSWDRNRDNVVTCDEWKAYATELFDGADKNRDGGIEASEWTHILAVDKMFQTADHNYYDADNDGKVTRAEFVDRQNPAFKLMDNSNSCSLNGAQIAGARSKTEYDNGGEKKKSGDPREAATGQQGKVANGGL